MHCQTLSSPRWTLPCTVTYSHVYDRPTGHDAVLCGNGKHCTLAHAHRGGRAPAREPADDRRVGALGPPAAVLPRRFDPRPALPRRGCRRARRGARQGGGEVRHLYLVRIGERLKVGTTMHLDARIGAHRRTARRAGLPFDVLLTLPAHEEADANE